MDNQNLSQFPDIPAEKLRLVQKDRKLFDQKLETKPIGYFKDAWLRFKKDRSAVVAFVLIVILLLFSVIVPLMSSMNVSFRDGYYEASLPGRDRFLGRHDGPDRDPGRLRLPELHRRGERDGGGP